MKARHIMADGTTLDSISGKELPDGHQAYAVLQIMLDKAIAKNSTTQKSA